MKKFLALCSVIGAFAFIPLSTANAADGYTRLVGYNHCGQPIYAVFHVHGYDACGRPVGHWVTQQPTPPRVVYPTPYGSGHSHGHGHHGHGHGHSHGHGHGGKVYIHGSGSGWGFQVVR